MPCSEILHIHTMDSHSYFYCRRATEALHNLQLLNSSKSEALTLVMWESLKFFICSIWYLRRMRYFVNSALAQTWNPASGIDGMLGMKRSKMKQSRLMNTAVPQYDTSSNPHQSEWWVKAECLQQIHIQIVVSSHIKLARFIGLYLKKFVYQVQFRLKFKIWMNLCRNDACTAKLHDSSSSSLSSSLSSPDQVTNLMMCCWVSGFDFTGRGFATTDRHSLMT